MTRPTFFLGFLVLVHIPLCTFGALQTDDSIARLPYFLEVKGPASQALHKQSIERFSRILDQEELKSGQPTQLNLPLSKEINQHVSVFSVSLYTFLMACASVMKFQFILDFC